jgi:phosphoadenosine phosphosulfate reductase
MTMKRWTEDELKKISDTLEGNGAEDSIRWAVENFCPDLALACSFGAEDVALVDMLVKINPTVKIFYLDTDILFKETYEVKDKLIKKYGISPARYGPSITLKDQARIHGDKLWATNPDLCCKIRKLEPLISALKGLKCWITGIRREQAATRANARIVEWDNKFNLVKINPLVKWTTKDVWKYIHKYNVPYNTLYDKGYPSIGCEPCTRPVKPGEDERSGRWAGFQKTECGLHNK